MSNDATVTATSGLLLPARQIDWLVPNKRNRDEDGLDPMRKVIFDAIGQTAAISSSRP